MAREMKPLISHTNNQGFHRIILEPDPAVGVYIFIYENECSKHPERDYLQDDLDMAMQYCREDLGVPDASWAAYDAPTC